jgi:hypothetical protein
MFLLPSRPVDTQPAWLKNASLERWFQSSNKGIAAFLRMWLCSTFAPREPFLFSCISDVRSVVWAQEPMTGQILQHAETEA